MRWGYVGGIRGDGGQWPCVHCSVHIELWVIIK